MSYAPYDEDFNYPSSSERLTPTTNKPPCPQLPKQQHISVMRIEYLNNWKVC